MDLTQLINYLVEYFDELIENGERRNYQHCCNRLFTEINTAKILRLQEEITNRNSHIQGKK